MKKVNEIYSINLKLPEELKRQVKEKANIKEQTVSKYIRELLSSYLDGTLCLSQEAMNQRKEFINSTEFLQLIVWMYTIRKEKKFKETPEELDGYIRTLKKIDQHLPREIVMEFDKVLSDVLRVKGEPSRYPKEYKFAVSYSSTPEFNFNLLENYLLSFDKPKDNLI